MIGESVPPSRITISLEIQRPPTEKKHSIIFLAYAKSSDEKAANLDVEIVHQSEYFCFSTLKRFYSNSVRFFISRKHSPIQYVIVKDLFFGLNFLNDLARGAESPLAPLVAPLVCS